MANYLIGIDCGSTMVKAAIFDETEKEYAVSKSSGGHLRSTINRTSCIVPSCTSPLPAN
ncbi:MAG: hypothetical protein LBH00_03555 [Planctomycetaceae bacterium]|nr:hypothetical protein [Planctomycetaceae bacterium]